MFNFLTSQGCLIYGYFPFLVTHFFFSSVSLQGCSACGGDYFGNFSHLCGHLLVAFDPFWLFWVVCVVFEWLVSGCLYLLSLIILLVFRAVLVTLCFYEAVFVPPPPIFLSLCLFVAVFLLVWFVSVILCVFVVTLWLLWVSLSFCFFVALLFFFVSLWLFPHHCGVI